MGLSGGKKVQAPKYKKFEGNAYTNQLEEDLGGYHDWVQANWEKAVTAPKLEDYYQYVKQVNKPAMDDFLQNYNTQANAIAARNYNRFGGLRNTPASYTQDMLNSQMNNLAVKQTSQMLSDAHGMKNTDWNNQLTALNQVYGMYNQAGDYVTQNKDIPNWNIENLNEANRVAAANANAQRSFNPLGTALSTIGGAVSGFAMGGPAGAIAGGIGGLASGLGSGQSAGLGTGFQLGTQMNSNRASGLNWLNNKLGYRLTP